MSQPEKLVFLLEQEGRDADLLGSVSVFQRSHVEPYCPVWWFLAACEGEHLKCG